MTMFVLVHGAWHGAWCWDRVVPELQARGHRALAVDLPSDDPSATTETYVSAIDASIDDPASTVLVAHSMAGLVAPVCAERRPVRQLVLLSCLLPLPGSSWRDQLAFSRPMTEDFYRTYLPRQTRDDQGRSAWPAETGAELFYHDCAPADASAAAGRLRPQAPAVLAEKSPWQGHVPSPTRYVVCTDDRAVSGSWARRTAEERFGVGAESLASSHSPFWSRPAALADLLTAGLAPGGAASPAQELTQ
jgi:pimeloyl-ACP methyl ester carboxylesterase